MFEEQWGNNHETITVVSFLFICIVIHCHRLSLRIFMSSKKSHESKSIYCIYISIHFLKVFQILMVYWLVLGNTKIWKYLKNRYTSKCSNHGIRSLNIINTYVASDFFKFIWWKSENIYRKYIIIYWRTNTHIS